MSENKLRKIILLVVEGPSDRTTLENAFRNTLKLLHPECEVKVEVVHGDGTLKRPFGHYFTSGKVISETTKLISEHFDLLRSNYGIELEDILGVAQICDLDACYAADDSFHYDPSANGVVYHPELKNVCCKYVADLVKKRNLKCGNLMRLSATNHLTLQKTKIPYQIFYFGIDLEFALYRQCNLTDAQKASLSESFDDEYGDGGEPFMRKLKSIPSISMEYRASWNDKELTRRAFDAISNFTIIFDWIVFLLNTIKDSGETITNS